MKRIFKLFKLLTIILFFCHVSLAASTAPAVDNSSKLAGKISGNDLPVQVKLTEQEQAWLNRKLTVRVRVGTAPPYHFMGSEPHGISVDYLKLIGTRSGINFSFVDSPVGWQEAVDDLTGERKRFDLLITIARSPEREKKIAFTNDYLYSPFVIVNRTGTPFVSRLEDLNGRSVAVERGYIVKEKIEKGYPQVRTVAYEKTLDALKAVATGTNDAHVGNLTIATYLIQKYGLDNLKIAAPAPFGSHDQAMGVRSDWPELASIINTYLMAMSDAEKSDIHNRWLSVKYEYGINLKRVWSWAAGLTATFTLILAVTVIWNRKLKKEIDRRVIAEKTLSENEEKYRNLFNNSEIAMFRTRLDGSEVLDVNRRFLNMLGKSEEETVGKPSVNFWADPQEREEMVRILLADGRVSQYQYKMLDHQGGIKNCITSLVLYREQGVLEGSIIDITDLKGLEKELHDTLEIFSLFMKHSPVYAYIKEITPTGVRVLQASENFEEMVGIPGSKMIGKTMAELFPAEFAAKTDADDRAVVAKGEMLKIDEELNGRYYTTIKFPLVKEDRTLLAGFTIDITERKLAEDSLEENRERLRCLSDATYEAIFISEKGRCLEQNKRAEELFGYSAKEALGRFGTEWIVPEDRDLVTTNMMSGYELPYEATGLRKDGSTFPAHIRGRVMHFKGSQVRVTLVTDITGLKQAENERLHLEKQLLHAQKLESLGVLAGGIAHDFNNLLTAIMGNADLALMRLNPESPAVDNLKRIEQATARAADLAKQMLAYSGKGKFVVEHLDISRLVKEMLHMLEVSISKKAVLRCNLTTPLPSVEADATQMRQIIMNLVINASEAIGDRSGVIAITSGCMECDCNYLKDVWLDENLSGGLYVYLEIADSGCGMDKATMAKLFDPFFTTKFTGRGLGMAAVLGIVRGHKGAIKVFSELNKGTTFKILLPASDRPAELFNGAAHADDWQGSGTVLLVDDEETVRGIGREMLQELGFTVITADDGRAGIAAFKENPDVAFVILDLTMPHMDGEQCFLELKQLKPDVKVMISSGYSEQEVSIKFVGKGLAGFIQKPYTLSMLRDAVRTIL